jgi:transposase
LLKEVESLTEKIKDSDREIEQIARKDYPETVLLQQVGGVGPLIALTFILTVEDKGRFQKSRDIGCYVGLRPRRSDSGQSQPQLRITKEGDPYLRTMLVQGAHYIISRRGPDIRCLLQVSAIACLMLLPSNFREQCNRHRISSFR